MTVRSASLRGGLDGATSAVLVLHGGQEKSHEMTSRWQLSYVRMLDLYWGLRVRSSNSAVYLLRYRVRGWNADGGIPAPVTDARWALEQVSQNHPDAPIALLGHSMGGRTAFAVADHPQVVGVCGLAPWLPPGETLPRVRPDQRFVVAHGTADTMTSAELSAAYARRLGAAGAKVAAYELSGGRHALLDRPRLWHAFAVRTSLGLVGDQPLPAGMNRIFHHSGGTLPLPLESFAEGDTGHD